MKTIPPNALAAPRPTLPPNLLARNTRKAPKLERGSGDAPLGAKKVQGRNCPEFFVRITSVRKRLIDEDNLCEKYHVDLCRYAGVISGDEAGKTKIETTQCKVEKGGEEKILIEVRVPIDKPKPLSDNDK